MLLGALGLSYIVKTKPSVAARDVYFVDFAILVVLANQRIEEGCATTF